MRLFKVGFAAGAVAAAAVSGVGLWAISTDLMAQTATSCKSIYNSNVTMFERMVAEQIDRGWVVKGGMYKDQGGFGVLTCSR